MASSSSVPQSAMSPAPTRTGSSAGSAWPGGGAAGGARRTGGRGDVRAMPRAASRTGSPDGAARPRPTRAGARRRRSRRESRRAGERRDERDARPGRLLRREPTGRSMHRASVSRRSGVVPACRAGQSPAASRSARSKRGVVAREQTVEVLAGVRDEVDIERADPLLEDAPHRLAEVGDDPHQREAGEPVAVGRRPS